MMTNKRELVFFFALLAIPLAAWYLDFKPRNEQHAQLRKEIQTKRTKLAEIKGLAAKIGDLQGEIQATQEVVDHFQQQLPQETEIDKVLRGVWQLAQTNKLQAKKIRSVARRENDRFTPPNSPHGEQAVQLQIQGDFRGFYAFLLALERQPRIMRIREVMLERDKDLPDGHMAATIELSVFFERKSNEKSCQNKNKI